ncbi:MAG: bifunctional UDP-N-acetylglucosamine diphosphorylase/glucosamine-1-phosphate N-acetyltransferase GlmU [Hahellaceae bacterium]|nr:bifunctional UDP-N-acetylglucosamine diphosphorylase/glucosamine-1-phosphate N-acetyltransferase GlmU [Hahellaceae bacterium]MCP5210035.1 bifunctional UDP-N-acetylglucosamine diphosphorylase/glucosamine-1-phosphate N-acetyltransferase GlmU [Hahellaceae bacterium]
MQTEVVILAAGQGSRMKSSLPKVLHCVAGTPMLGHVIRTSRHIGAIKTHVVIGHGADLVKAQIPDEVCWALQDKQLGTGHAVAQTLSNLSDESRVLILYGDVPLIKESTLLNLLEHVNDSVISLLTVKLQDPSGYGRIIRDENGYVKAIVEQKDANPDQLRVNEINTGIMAVPAKKLKEWLPKLSNKNAQGEYYLTDIIAMAADQNVEIAVAHPTCEQEVQGVNNRVQLAELERWYQLRIAEELMSRGATLADPNRIDVRGNLQVGQDVTIDVGCIFEGDVILGENVSIGPYCVIRNSNIGSNSTIDANTLIDETLIGSNCNVGPFARLRPGTKLSDSAKVGNFVETKKAIVGRGSKINHLSYIGDTSLGENVNIGAGTITCNYDGVNKFKTTIGDNVFVGSNSALVAPVTIDSGATIGAGSTITKDVEKEQLAIARAKQRSIDGWNRPKKKE